MSTTTTTTNSLLDEAMVDFALNLNWFYKRVRWQRVGDQFVFDGDVLKFVHPIAIDNGQRIVWNVYSGKRGPGTSRNFTNVKDVMQLVM